MDTEVLAQLIDAKYALLVELHQLATRQAGVIDSGDLSRLMSLLATKQQLLNAVTQLEGRMDPFRAEDPDRRVWPSSAHRQRAREIAARSDQLLGEIMAVERNCEQQLIQRRDQVAERLQKHTNFSTHVANAYLSPDRTSGGQFDVSCET